VSFEGRVRSFFQIARSVFFPKWDPCRRWTVVVGERQKSEGETGYCCSREKIVYISPQATGMTDVGLQAFLIHEICHDVAAAFHNRKWLRRMQRAAEKARGLGMESLASSIEDDAFSCVRAGCYLPLSACEVYEFVGEKAFANPDWTDERIIQDSAEYFGVRRASLVRRFPGLGEEIAEGRAERRRE